MPLTEAEKKAAIASAVKIADSAVANAGSQALNHPEQVVKLIDALSATLQELTEKTGSGK